MGWQAMPGRGVSDQEAAAVALADKLGLIGKEAASGAMLAILVDALAFAVAEVPMALLRNEAVRIVEDTFTERVRVFRNMLDVGAIKFVKATPAIQTQDPARDLPSKQ